MADVVSTIEMCRAVVAAARHNIRYGPRQMEQLLAERAALDRRIEELRGDIETAPKKIEDARARLREIPGMTSGLVNALVERDSISPQLMSSITRVAEMRMIERARG